MGLFNTVQQLQAIGTMHFKPENGDKVPANTPIPINGEVLHLTPQKLVVLYL
jgi:hypothetical protein